MIYWDGLPYVVPKIELCVRFLKSSSCKIGNNFAAKTCAVSFVAPTTAVLPCIHKKFHNTKQKKEILLIIIKMLILKNKKMYKRKLFVK